jgi:Protein involved in initiation of plasmid replication
MSNLSDQFLLEDDGQLSLKVEEVPAEIKDYYWVTQSNDFINLRHNLSLMERRIIFALASLVQPDDDEFKTYTIYVKDLADLLGLSGRSIYDRVEKTIDQLQSKQLVIESDKILHKITWIQSAAYIKGEGRVRIKLSEDLAPFFRNLSSRFTRYRLKYVFKLQSVYSWRMYELLKEREFRKERIFTVKELREKLEIPPDKYKMLKHLRALLDSTQAEIEEKTDIKFTYDVYKRKGRAVESFIFRIEHNYRNMPQEKEAASYDAEKLLTMLAKYGIHRKKAIQLATRYHPFYIEDNVRYVITTVPEKNIRNLAGYIIKAIEHNYAGSVHDVPYDDALFDMELRHVSEELEEMTKADIESLNQIIESYKNILHRGTLKTVDEIQMIGQEREEMLLRKLDAIQAHRKKQHKPPLLYEDVQDNPLLRDVYEKWEQMQFAEENVS